MKIQNRTGDFASIASVLCIVTLCFSCSVAQEETKAQPTAVSKAVSWLEQEAHRIIRASKREMADGTAAFPPQVGIHYEAFWLRDYEYTLEGAISAYSDKELLDACRLFVRSINKNGEGVDCIRFDGSPIYKPGMGSMGENPVADGGPFTVAVAWHTFQRTKNAILLHEILNNLVKTMNAVPRNPTSGLVFIDPEKEYDRCPYGFTDTIRKKGHVLFCSLLYTQACRQLSDLLRSGNRSVEAGQWRSEAQRVSENIRTMFWDGEIGLFRAATVQCREHDIWGSAFAVYLGVAAPEQSTAIATYFKTHYNEIVQHGQIRHLPGGVFWEVGRTRDEYQNGAYWATPAGWFVYTLDLVDSGLADQTILDLVNHCKQHGACEWIIGDRLQLPHYLASAALPLAGIRAMLERREKEVAPAAKPPIRKPPDLELTAVTAFGCNDKGEVIVAFRNNSGPVDAAWDLFLYKGDVFNPAAGDPETIKWLNDPKTHCIKIPLQPGTHTFTMHSDSAEVWPGVGMNLFFNGANDTAAISVKTSMDTNGPPFPVISKNSAQRTMGWPITDIPASGSLTCSGRDGGLLYTAKPAESFKVTLTHFRFSAPRTDGSLDLVGPHRIGSNGRSDFVGRFTLKVEKDEARPPDLFLWLETVADVNLIVKDSTKDWDKLFDATVVTEPFSFLYGKTPSHKILERFKRTSVHSPLDENRTSHKVRYVDPATGLQVRWEGLEYPKFKTVEWTLYFKNTGDSDTPILADIQALDTHLKRRKGCEFELHYNRGDSCNKSSFEPLVKTLAPETVFRQAPQGGRPTNSAFPYFNLRAGTEGVIIALGWPGQWAAQFSRDKERGIAITAGQELTHLTLHPGEEIRTPLIVLQFAEEGDWIDAQNAWRRWMILHNIPRPGGKTLQLPQFNACSSHQFAEMTKANEKNQIAFIDSYLAKGLQIDYWWMDAGWYVGAAENNWPWTGTWEVDRRPHRFPNGLRAVSDHAHKKEVDIIVWFEPERVAAGTWLATEHPEWILGGRKGGLLNLGDPQAWNWLVNHIDRIIKEEGIDLYRQDFNIDPLGFWRGNDAENRQGITENKHVMGYLAYWDALLGRHPGMLIDSCASGGRRNDLETLRRAVPLLRSDYLFEPTGQQCHTFGLSFWIPFYGTAYCPSNTVGWGWGTGGISYDAYTRRSNMCPANTACFDFRVDVDDKLIQKLYKEWIEVAPDFFGDYHPLTPYTAGSDSWIAWQFHRKGAGRGFVQAFRRPGNTFFGGQFKLKGLTPDAQYEVKNYDAPETIIATGRELMEKGLAITIGERPGAALIAYRRL